MTSVQPHQPKLTARLRLKPLLVLIACFLCATPALLAQGPATQPDNDTSRPAATPVPAASPAHDAVMKELDMMKKRIAELEAMLAKGDAASRTTAQATEETPTLSGQKLVQADAAFVNSAIIKATPQAVADKKPAKAEPFAFADWTWLNANPRAKDIPFDTKFFTPEIRFDVDYVYDFNHPADNTIGGSTEVFRANEVHLTQLGIGGDFHFDNVHGRVLTQLGLYSQGIPRNDPSPARGQYNLADAYRYISEANAGYHWDKLHGVNLDAGIFLSYVGLFSFYQYDNWAYQPSYVSSNTPWFFTGVRLQVFATDKLKIEPWLINGWQTYGRINHRPGIGGQILYRPNSRVSLTFNNYAVGRDTLGAPGRTRFHTDDSIQVKYYDNPSRLLDKSAFTFTLDLGCESGGGVSCFGTGKNGPKQSFFGAMMYNRVWFHHDLFAATVGGGFINNPGRYLVLLPPINGATAITGTPYFTENPGDPFKAYDVSGTFDYMPSQYITFRWEYNQRGANVPYFSGSGGITPPGGNTGNPGAPVLGWNPDLRKRENRMTMAILVYF